MEVCCRSIQKYSRLVLDSILNPLAVIREANRADSWAQASSMPNLHISLWSYLPGFRVIVRNVFIQLVWHCEIFWGDGGKGTAITLFVENWLRNPFNFSNLGWRGYQLPRTERLIWFPHCMVTQAWIEATKEHRVKSSPWAPLEMTLKLINQLINQTSKYKFSSLKLIHLAAFSGRHPKYFKYRNSISLWFNLNYSIFGIYFLSSSSIYLNDI